MSSAKPPGHRCRPRLFEMDGDAVGPAAALHSADRMHADDPLLRHLCPASAHDSSRNKIMVVAAA